jgi:two-component system sensor histidine kinase UhpB
MSIQAQMVDIMKLSKPQTDIIFVASLTLLFGMVASRWELSEHITEYSYVYEHIQLDEWPFSFLVLSMGLAWYSWRRSNEANLELQERIRSEQKVQELLRHNSDLAQRLYSAQEDERRALARELHDEMGQTCTAIRTEAAVLGMGKLDTTGVAQCAQRIALSAQALSQITRRMLQQLRPMVLDSMGLADALVAQCQQWQSSTGVFCDCQVDKLPDDLSDYLCVTIYRLVQEGLTNVARHANATRVEVKLLVSEAGELMLSIRDNGRGTPYSDASQKGFGVLGMQERVASLRGEFHWHSKENQGVHIRIQLPMEFA